MNALLFDLDDTLVVDGAIAAGLRAVWVNRADSPLPEDHPGLVKLSSLSEVPAALSGFAP